MKMYIDNVEITYDLKDWDEFEERLYQRLSSEIQSKLETLVEDCVCKMLVKCFNFPLTFATAARFLDVKEDTLRKREYRAGVTFTKIGGNKVITFQELREQLGDSVILQHIKNKH